MERYKYGTLIAKFIAYKCSPEEEKELDDWVNESPDNLKLFEDLTNEFKSTWAKQWFAKAGIKTGFIRWKKMEGWYEPERNSLKEFYILAAIGFLGLIVVYLILRYVMW